MQHFGDSKRKLFQRLFGHLLEVTTTVEGPSCRNGLDEKYISPVFFWSAVFFWEVKQ